jgi:drug/metabolite transporter (DMT)-like permease
MLVLAASQLVGLAGLVVWLALSGDSPPPRGDLLAAVGAGVAGCVGLAALYAGLSLGAMAIVAPVSALSPLVALFSDTLQGNRPQALELVGMGIALTGVAILSRAPSRGAPRSAVALGLALVAALGFGLFVIGLDAAADVSTPWATTTARLTSTLLAIAAVVALRQPVRRLSGVVPLVVAVGLFDTSANVFVALASTRGLVSIVATLSALYPIVTVVLAVALLGERPTRAQLGGGALALVGATLIAA